jgi:hypothetical protein
MDYRAIWGGVSNSVTKDFEPGNIFFLLSARILNLWV